MTEPIGKGIEIHWGLVARTTRIFIDGQDISRYVTRIVIDANAEMDDATSITLECLPLGGTPDQIIKGRLVIEKGEADAD